MLARIIILIIAISALSGCEKIALMTTPKKKPVASSSQLAKTAEDQFWDILHKGQYDHIPQVTEIMTAAYLQNPNDPKLASHLGFLHIWRITERARLKKIDATIVNEITLAHKYFADAAELNPDDARIQGFLGDSMLVEGKLFNDERLQVRGYFKLKHAISMWPEFNYFTAGYPMSTLDYHSSQFQQGLDWQWKTLSLCAGSAVSQRHPDFAPYMNRETTEGPKRACWNSWIAPHNFEGFFMNMGDMLVKTGEWETGIRIYNNAKLSKTYQQWPYRKMLEQRIAQAQLNATRFRKNNLATPDATVMFNSGYGCAACHQAK
jgi:hypothetical protein